MSYAYKSKTPDYAKAYINNPKWKGSQAFGRIYVSLVMNPKFESLSVYAQNLFFRILLHCCTSGDYLNLSCVYPKSEIKKHFDLRTFQKAREELLTAGFIRQKRTTARGQRILYRLSSNWYKYNGEVPIEERYY